MKWADFLLRLVLKARDRDTISGDLLEEYREVVLPTNGPLAARLWYARQIVSFISPTTWGVAIGTAAGAVSLISTAIEPLADDSVGVMIIWFGSLILLWSLVGFGAAERTHRVRDAVTAAAIAGVATMAVFELATIVRANVFVDQIRYRADWQNLVARFEASGAHSLRRYATRQYIAGTPILLAVGACAGAVAGALGGAVSNAIHGPAPMSRGR
jgi:hypothetical protein